LDEVRSNCVPEYVNTQIYEYIAPPDVAVDTARPTVPFCETHTDSIYMDAMPPPKPPAIDGRPATVVLLQVPLAFGVILTTSYRLIVG
jgi:hypothetical protein